MNLLGPTAGRTALLLAAALSLPWLGGSLFADDYYHQLLITQAPGAPGTPWHQFTFATGDWSFIRSSVENGPLPWWTLPEVRFDFLRPLSCALAMADSAVFGQHFALHHLHSVLWYLALVATVTALVRRAFGEGTARPLGPLAALTVLLFALDDAHALVAGWLANRNALVATVPALLGVLAHVRWREAGWRPGLPLSLVGVAIGLAGGETALGAVTYLLAYEVTAAPGRWAERGRALVPLAVLGLGYIALYRALGAGAYGSEIYVDPLRDPLTYLAQAPVKALVLLGAQFLGSAADFWLVLPRVRPALVGTGVVAVVMVAFLLRRAWPRLADGERRGVRWLALGGAASLVPVLATFPLNRLLLMPSIGGAAVLAVLLREGWRATDDRALRWGARVLFFTTVVIGLPGWFVTLAGVRLGGDFVREASLRPDLPDQALAGRVYVFVAADPATAMYTPMIRALDGKPATAWLTFSFARYAHRLSRLDARSFELEVVDGRMMETLFEQLVRGRRFPLAQGEQRKLAGVTVTVAALDQGLPSRLRLEFDAEPESSGDTFARWNGGRLTALVLPGVGETLELPRIESPMAP